MYVGRMSRGGEPFLLISPCADNDSDVLVGVCRFGAIITLDTNVDVGLPNGVFIVQIL